MFSNFLQCYQVIKDHLKITKMHFLMIQNAKKDVFGHFLEFGLLDRLDIADCGSTRCSVLTGFTGLSSLTVKQFKSY